jgi:MFS family permease
VTEESRGSGPRGLRPTAQGPALAAATSGAALVPLNSTMIAVAIPDISDDLDVAPGAAGTLVLSYLVAMAVLQPLTGRLGDRFGSRRVSVASLVLFAVASAAAVVAPGFPALVASRCLQAIAGASFMPNLQALLQQATDPATRGRAFGFFGSGIGAGAAAGPVVGGLLVAAGGWRAIFAVNVPLVLVALSFLTRVEDAPAAGPNAPAQPQVGRQPLLSKPSFLAACVVQGASNFGQYALLLAMPLILDGLGWSSASTGLVLAAQTVSLLVLSPLGGRLGDSAGRRAPVVAGMAVMVGGLGLAAVVGEVGAIPVLVTSVALVGVGMGLSTASVQAGALEVVPLSRSATAAGVLQTSRYLGSITSSAALSLFVSEGGRGARALFVTALAFAAVALAAAVRLPSRAMLAVGPARGPLPSA